MSTSVSSSIFAREMDLKLTHNILRVKDLNELIKFYVNNFGMKNIEISTPSLPYNVNVLGYTTNYDENFNKALNTLPSPTLLEFHHNDSSTNTSLLVNSGASKIYWKIGMTLYDVDHARQILQSKQVNITDASQFEDIGYLCHLKDLNGFCIELLQHDFDTTFKAKINQKSKQPPQDKFPLGYPSCIGQITLHANDMDKTQRFYQDLLGMKLLSIQEVPKFGFTLYFFAWTNEDPPKSDIKDVTVNREWLWKRPYTTLEIRHFHSSRHIPPFKDLQENEIGFEAQTTQEILDELRPRICPFDSSFVNTIKMFTLLLPVNLPPDLHNQGFKLWLAEFFGIWANIQKTSAWKSYLCVLFSSVAWNNIGHIHWEPWMPQIFTHILRSFSLPIGKIQISLEEYNPIVSTSTKWIIAMIGNGGSCLQYLRDLLMAMKSFYHPSNTGAFQKDLVEFILGLAQNFVDRVHLERTSRPVWSFAPLESYRLTEQDITDFVNCVKDYAFISIFNKDYTEEAAKTCKYLSILRPELIIPSIVEKHFSSIDCMTEPHRFTSIITCLTHIARQIVQQSSAYSQGQIYVLPILMSVLPGIDLNDLEKTSVTLEFLDTILMLITCVDCSSAVNTRNDLTEIEKEVCLSTANFEDFIVEFLNRIFQMIDVLSADMSDAVTNNADIDIDDIMINWKLTTIMFNIVQQCSSKIFQKIREKVINFVSGVCLSSRVRDIVSSLVQALVKGNPVETLKYLMPKTCESIEKILNNSESTILLTDHKGDIELTWYLILFAELVHARGDALMIYKSMIMSVFRQCIYFINKNSYETIAHAIEHLLESLTHVYPIDYRLTVENIDEPFVDFLPIRAWGQYVDFNKLQVQFHIPNEDEIDFACEFVNTFLYPELTLLNEKGLKISNDERLRSLTIIQSIATECFRMIPRIESEQIQNLIPSVVPFESKYQIQFPIYSKELISEFKENLRMRLFIDIGKLLDLLIENNSDDVASMTTALKFYSLTSIYYGINESYIEFSRDEFTSHEQLLKNKLCGEGQNNRFLSIQKIGLQIEELELSNVGILNDIDKQIILKLFELSINRYSEVRCAAQTELFKVLKYYQFSFQVIIDRIAELFNTQDEVDHDQIKGCLYILLGDDSFFLPTKYSWAMKEKLWPSIVRMAHANKISIQNLIDDIHEKICDEFVTQVIIQNTNEISIHAAIGLWHPLEPSEIETRNESNQTDIQSYSNLIEALNLSLVDDILTWGQQKIAIGLLCLLLQKFVPISSSCIETFVGFLVHDNIELRRYATIGIVAFCRLQKSPRIYIEKSLEEIFHNISKSLPVMMNDECYPGDRDDNSWVTIDDYKPPETQIEWEQTCFLDKPFHENLREFQWRIPSVWCKINDYAKTLLDHPYKDVRESIANILSISISFDITLFNGKSTRQPNTSQFIDTICKQLQQAIEIHERTSLINISDEVVGIDLEARKALNFIEAGILGLCAIVLSSPYDIPTYVPDALMLLCEHSHDPDIIQKSIKNCLSEFRRTHHDSWHEHREQFTEDQLAVLADVLISHSYYA
ncbi:unnamed protein product [Rotaria sordida]|uniref:VOC domain-containing protein n=1 Tax=Rotaria sordida TaxID=392033 RepID=A0A818P173_9BILA|nr:unnamed protein product [Rotaria sordida]